MHILKKIFRTYSNCVEIHTLFGSGFFILQPVTSRIFHQEFCLLGCLKYTGALSFVVCTSAFNLISCVSLFNDVVQPDKNKGKNATVNIWMWIDHYVTSYIFHLTCSYQDITNKVFSRFVLKVCLMAYLVMTFRYL